MKSKKVEIDILKKLISNSGIEVSEYEALDFTVYLRDKNIPYIFKDDNVSTYPPNSSLSIVIEKIGDDNYRIRLSNSDEYPLQTLP